MDQELDHLWEEIECSWDNTFKPAKHRRFLRHREEFNALHVTQYTEPLVVHDQWRTDPWYFWRYLYGTVLQNECAKHSAEYTTLVKQRRRQLVHVDEHEHEVGQAQPEAKKRNRRDIVIE